MYTFPKLSSVKNFSRIAILTSGGDAPGMNAAIRAVVRTAVSYSIERICIYRGFSGLVEGDAVTLTSSSVKNIIQRGGTVLRSDRWMYEVKNNGKADHRIFTLDLHERAQEQNRIEMLLRDALIRDEFCMHYQPVVDMRNGTVIGFEALLRWHNSELGGLSPAIFIPIAENALLICPIGRWVIREDVYKTM